METTDSSNDSVYTGLTYADSAGTKNGASAGMYENVAGVSRDETSATKNIGLFSEENVDTSKAKPTGTHSGEKVDTSTTKTTDIYSEEKATASDKVDASGNVDTFERTNDGTPTGTNCDVSVELERDMFPMRLVDSAVREADHADAPTTLQCAHEVCPIATTFTNTSLGGDIHREEQMLDILDIPFDDSHVYTHVEKTVSEKTFMDGFLKGIGVIAEDDAMCDVTLVVDGMRFRCHKVILAAFSEYFRAIFTIGMKETSQNEIHLTGFHSNTVQKMLQSIYTGYEAFTVYDGRALLQAAVFFGIESLRRMCEISLSSAVDIHNVIPLWRTSKNLPECRTLKSACEDYLLSHFECITAEDIIDLDKDEFIFLISNPYLQVTNEDKVCQAARTWFACEGDVRKPYLADVFEHIRLPFVSKELLSDFKNNFKYLKEASLEPFMNEEIKYKKHPSCRMDEFSTRTTLRQNYSNEKVLILLSNKSRVSSKLVSCLWVYRFTCRSWYRLQSELFKLGPAFATCVYGESELYFSGGQGRRTFQRFDGMLDKIVSCTQMSTSRMNHCMVCVSDAIYVLGGNGFMLGKRDIDPIKEEKLEAVEIFRPLENTWRHCGKIMTAVSGAAACVSGRLVYLYGGSVDKANKEPSNLTQFFDTKTNTSGYLLANLPFTTSNLSAVNVRGVTYILGYNAIFSCKDEINYTCTRRISVREQPAADKRTAMAKDVNTLYIIQTPPLDHQPLSRRISLFDSLQLVRYDTETDTVERVSGNAESITFMKYGSLLVMHTLIVNKNILHEHARVDTDSGS